MNQPLRFPRFFVTAESPCSYLPGRAERKVFAELRGARAPEVSDALGRMGFRRSQNVAYRPACSRCTACVSVRIVAADFTPTRTQRRTWRRNRALDWTVCQPWATEEQYGLIRRYLDTRHPEGGMSRMDGFDFADMVEASPVDTRVVEYRLPAGHPEAGRLIAASLTDWQGDGLSMIYSFYDPDIADHQGLGTYMIMHHAHLARGMGLPYVYLGYWVRGSERMDYKRNFAPLEQLTRDGWRPFAPDDDGSRAAPPPLPTHPELTRWRLFR